MKLELKKWFVWSYIKKRLKDAFYASAIILLGWLSYKYTIGAPIDIINKPAMSTGYKICFTGDTGTGGKDQKLVASFIKKENCNELRIMGDIIYRNGLKDETDPQFFSKFWDIYKDLNIPVYLTMGNHDTRRNVGAWIKLAEKYDRVRFPYYYYAENYGGEVCFISLNTTVLTTIVKGDHEKEQEGFVTEVLDKFKNRCKLSISLGHHPLLSSGVHADAKGRTKKFYNNFLVGKIDVVIAGHDHNMSYEGKTEGTYHIVSGAGSKIRVPKKLKDISEKGPFKTDRGWATFKLGYHYMVYLGEGKAAFVEKFIKDGKIDESENIVEVKGHGIRSDN
ncbi:metallophosphoesterase, partial [bacterium]|nr:metallophosphoesterase [bacterium]